MEEASNTTPNSTTHILIALVTVLSILFFFLYIRNQTSSNVPVPSGTCSYNGITYKTGEGFVASDGCNSCSCSADGQVACTAMACESIPFTN